MGGSPKTSFRDKLVGEIPGAFAKAFDFTDLMDDDAESDDEIADLREGLAAVQLSKETKLRIRGPWSQTLIIKLYGRSMGFNFLQSKLQLLWKPAGRLDCVDLGYDFYSVRFTLKEDMDSVLEKGPWFIGGQFLLIRPWEPFFKPAVANVSSIAVWVRLHALPLELYETEVLEQIGDAIGKVLRIDAQTAMKARGKYARLCIQVDMNKPLINTVLIGKFEQPVSYEGIQKLCFTCGRLGHKKDDCPHIIRTATSPEIGGNDDHGDSAGSRMVHDMDSTIAGGGMSEGSGTAKDNDSYGPWMLVTRKKAGQRGIKNSTVVEGHTGSWRVVVHQFTTPIQTEVGLRVKGKSSGDSGGGEGSVECSARSSGCEVGDGTGYLTCHQAVTGVYSKPGVQADPAVQLTLNSKVSEQGGFVVVSDSALREGLDKENDGEAGMDYEDGGGVIAPA
ncbi:uncharacterized protein LOC136069532 [Quercus suber]|uniref:uncharacterized protein LOC111995577 n=1 Tax=Quercus suber TaxID=58331 RepID=UPI000CE275A9|nr:uncharacterized protein LOC111995577 [Quercus suber]